MDMSFLQVLPVIVIPLLLAITLHEAGHAWVAHKLGDNTAKQLGRVSFNPIVHIDPFGTIILPLILLLSGTPFLFGYAKPVPVNYNNLRNPRRDMVYVALAGPLANILLVVIASLLLYVVGYLPPVAGDWLLQNIQFAIMINAILAAFNMLPIPPLDGGRVAVGLLPDVLARPLSRLEPYGMLIIIGLFLLPVFGRQFGMDLNILWAVLGPVIDFVQSLAIAIAPS
ncbi:site-2 protease family protein [Paremcibacter congregatus]|uniref:Site-2 protease family protein n=1 Tax=Paremcibacter congregatus TaxID=2043170 RepID=A0A2G4YMZ8_9PROT|nr:site-2 protease family protein [Paremcibacter congregatus]PHZ83692.1 site-2 protease family protein [Paremcibacter congregatus]QDE27395.1 site-2 protease family protein [Paremcibacter congregatus]